MISFARALRKQRGVARIDAGLRARGKPRFKVLGFAMGFRGDRAGRSSYEACDCAVSLG